MRHSRRGHAETPGSSFLQRNHRCPVFLSVKNLIGMTCELISTDARYIVIIDDAILNLSLLANRLLENYIYVEILASKVWKVIPSPHLRGGSYYVRVRFEEKKVAALLTPCTIMPARNVEDVEGNETSYAKMAADVEAAQKPGQILHPTTKELQL